jgi:predicted kinase
LFLVRVGRDRRRSVHQLGPCHSNVGIRLCDDRPMREPPTLLLVTGPPGTGKSTLAERAAELLDAPVLGWDWAMAALTAFDPVQTGLRRLSHIEHRRVGWSILWNLATAQLRLGRSAVLDGVAREVEVAATRHVARAAGARCLVVLTACSDEAVHRSRIDGRTRGIPGWYELDWNHVADVLVRWEPPAGCDLRLDSVSPLESNTARLRELLRR